MHMDQVLENHHNNVEYHIAPVELRVLEYTFIYIFSFSVYFFKGLAHNDY